MVNSKGSEKVKKGCQSFKKSKASLPPSVKRRILEVEGEKQVESKSSMGKKFLNIGLGKDKEIVLGVEVTIGKEKVQDVAMDQKGKLQKLEDLEIIDEVNMVEIDLVDLDVSPIVVESVGKGKENLESLGSIVHDVQLEALASLHEDPISWEKFHSNVVIRMEKDGTRNLFKIFKWILK